MFFKLRSTALKHGLEYLHFLPWKCLLCLHHPIFWCKHSWQEWFGLTLLCLGVKVRSCPQKSLSVTVLLAGCGLSSMGTTQSLGSHSLLCVPCEAGEGGTGEEMFSSLTESLGLLSGTVVMGTCSPCCLCPSVTFCSGAGLYFKAFWARIWLSCQRGPAVMGRMCLSTVQHVHSGCISTGESFPKDVLLSSLRFNAFSKFRPV